MVLPIGDAPNPRGVPYVTYALIAANVAVYVLVTLPLSAAKPPPGDPLVAEYLRAVGPALHDRIPLDVLRSQLTAYDLFVFTRGFVPEHPSLVAVFVSMFLHGGLLHLAGNMLFLWIYGERRAPAGRRPPAHVLAPACSRRSRTGRRAGLPLPVVGASWVRSPACSAAIRVVPAQHRAARVADPVHRRGRGARGSCSASTSSRRTCCRTS